MADLVSFAFVVALRINAGSKNCSGWWPYVQNELPEGRNSRYRRRSRRSSRNIRASEGDVKLFH